MQELSLCCTANLYKSIARCFEGFCTKVRLVRFRKTHSYVQKQNEEKQSQLIAAAMLYLVE
jgi:hypothetical protein